MRSKNSETQVIQYEEYRLSVAELVVAMGKGAGICGVLSFTFYRSLAVFFVMLPVCFLYPRYEKRRLRDKRRQELAVQFKESMVALASALSAGYSMENALAVSRSELAALYGEEGLIVREFSYMIQQVRMNRSIERALDEFGDRAGLDDIRNFAEIFMVAKRSGGDLGGIMRHTAEVIRDKMQVKEEIRTMTASRQFEQKVMNLIPFFIVFYVEGASPGFFGQMYGTMAGRVLMSGCMVVYLAAIWLADRILRIEV